MSCKLVKANGSKLYKGKQGEGTFREGISSLTSEADAICMHALTLLPGTRGVAHLHADHETAIYMIFGEVDTWWGDELENFATVRPGDFFHIPANVPHLPWNRTGKPAFCVVSRTDPNEQESVVVLPELELKFQERIARGEFREAA